MQHVLPLTVLLAACRSEPVPEPPPTGEVVLLHTSDEHGWIEPHTSPGVEFGGPATLAALWDRNEGRSPHRHLTLSGGDVMLGGAAISQWFRGEPAIEVMNAMGYDAAAIGNHELDLGPELFRDRVAQAEFDWLAVNVELVEDVPFPRTRFSRLFRVGEIDVGVIGMGNPNTGTGNPQWSVEGMAFPDPVERIDAEARSLRQDGAEVVVVLSHVCSDRVGEYLSQLAEPIDVWLTGHCHRMEVRVIDGVTVLGSGQWWEAYGRVAIDVIDGEVDAIEAHVELASWPQGSQPPVEPDAGVEAVVAAWSERIDEALGTTIGHTETGIPNGWALGNLFVDAWREALPEADIAVLNRAALRAHIPAGEITIEDIVDVAPFENRIVFLELTGQQLQVHYSAAWNVSEYVSGITYGGLERVRLADGSPLDPSATYTVATTDYYATLPDRDFARYPIRYETGLHYGDPVITLLGQLGTTPEDPLEDHLDWEPRGP